MKGGDVSCGFVVAGALGAVVFIVVGVVVVLAADAYGLVFGCD